MRRLILVLAFIILTVGGFCDAPQGATGSPIITGAMQSQLVEKMLKKFGNEHQERIKRGVAQSAVFWQKEDGTPEEFDNLCLGSFASDPVVLKLLFNRIEKNLESIRGYFHRITRDLKEPLDLDIDEELPINDNFAKFVPDDHMQEDFFKLKIAFMILVNFPQTSLEDKLRDGPKWSREQWAQTRFCDLFPARVPSEVSQKVNAAEVESEAYVNEYNLFPKYFLTAEKKSLFSEDLKLISHWGLRDHLKALYPSKDGLPAQEMIYKAMERIIDQSIPKTVINQKTYWDPYANTVFEKDGDQYKQIQSVPEGDLRYARMIANFKAHRLEDPFYPKYPRYIDRRFDLTRQISEKAVEDVLVSLLSSDVAPKVGELISKKLGRPLKPFDIWFTNFNEGQAIPEKELDAKVKAKYPNLEAFQKDIPNILAFLGFTPEKAKFLNERIAVDPARGGGHATPAMMKTDKSHLRTRVPKGGMDYQGFNTGMHELGHNVEQTFSLFNSDFYMLGDVPNSACTECFAFVFQNRDLDVLGLKSKDPLAEDYLAIQTFWEAFEIGGVSLVDMKVWRWLYEHPDATPAQLKDYTIEVAKEVWNKYFAPVFNIKDCTILGIYSHMIAYPLYLCDYPLGHVISYQIEDYLKGKSLGTEMERMCKQGYVTPKQWIENAVGSDISSEALIKKVREALAKVNK